jgi:hypothetical protein
MRGFLRYGGKCAAFPPQRASSPGTPIPVEMTGVCFGGDVLRSR